MEAADTLFGVTMGAEGVSQVVARRLSRDVEGPAQPYVRRALRAIPGGRSGVSPAGPDVDREAWAELFELAAAQAAEEAVRARRGPVRPPAREPDHAAPDHLAPARGHLRARSSLTADDLGGAGGRPDHAPTCGVDATLDLVEELRGEAEQGRITSGADLSRALWEAVAARMADRAAAHPPRPARPRSS